MSSNKKRSLTLIEMMLVMTLIAIGLGTLGFQVAKALKKERFERGVEQVMGKISLAQEVMLDFHTDVTLTLYREGEEIECRLETDLSLPSQIEKGLNRYHTIEGIEEIAFNDEIRRKIILQFEGGVGSTPQGKLTFLGQGDAISIHLKGYPTQIRREQNRGGENGPTLCQADYPEEIFSAL
jgi:type II secretory pathway pseudopilin PulG